MKCEYTNFGLVLKNTVRLPQMTVRYYFFCKELLSTDFWGVFK